MKRLVSMAVVSVVAVAASGAVRAGEGGFVDFRTGEIVDSTPDGRADDFGELVNRKHPDLDLEPLAVGNFWVYESYAEGGDKPIGRYVVRISERIEEKDGVWYVYRTDGEFVDGEMYRQRRDDNAIYYKKPGESAHVWIPAAPRNGDAYVNAGGRFTIAETEKLIDSRWGKLTCVELIHSYQSDGSLGRGDVGTDVIDRYLYQPGVGVVMIISKEGSDRLIGFNVDN